MEVERTHLAQSGGQAVVKNLRVAYNDDKISD